MINWHIKEICLVCFSVGIHGKVYYLFERIGIFLHCVHDINVFTYSLVKPVL